MHTAKDVAEYMFSQFEIKDILYQETIVYKIKEEFGESFVYTNPNGNLAIDKKVLKEFGVLTKGIVVWERSYLAWRKLKENEKYKGRQIN